MNGQEFDLQIVVPVYNEAENLGEFTFALASALQEFNGGYSVIFVDDGSSDNSWELIVSIANESDMKISAIRLQKNYGQMIAIEAGLEKSSSNFVLTMDCDLQHPPLFIHELWQIRNENACIAAQQVDRQENYFKKSLSQLFYVCMKILTGIEISPNVSDFRLYPRSAIVEILALNDSPKVFRFVIPRLGIPQIVLPYYPGKRLHGKSKYNFKSMFKLAKTSLFSSTTRLLSMGIALSFLYLIFAAALTFYVVYIVLDNQAIPGWVSVIMTQLVSFSGIFAVLGVIGLYIEKIEKQLDRIATKKAYRIKETIN